MNRKFDLKGKLDKVASSAAAAAKEAGETLGAASSTASEVASSTVRAAAKTAGGIAGSVVRGASSAGETVASSPVGETAKAAAKVVGSVASNAATTAVQETTKAASAIGDTVSQGLSTLQENSFAAKLRRSRIAGFKDGINQGAYLAAENRYNFYYAYVSALCFFLSCDGTYSAEEEDWLRSGLEHLRLNGGLPDEVKVEIERIARYESASFDQVKTHLDKLSIVSLESIVELVQCAAEIDGEVTDEELGAQAQFQEYVLARVESGNIASSWSLKAIEDSVMEYGENIDRINAEFKDKTKLHDSDIAFLMGATMLQVARVFILNALTRVEPAGANNVKEGALHDIQGKIFNGFNNSASVPSDKLYASKHHILTSRGVPYDATAGGKQYGIFKGANHRFATLAHDPVLGLVFGPANIMTNSITWVKNAPFGLKIPATNCVEFDMAGKNPRIAGSASTIAMLVSSTRRTINEPSAAAAALIKQIIHIGTDLYTPCGIQIPFANMVLDKEHVEKLTAYVSTGDILKVGAQAGLAVFINWLIASLHGSTLLFQDDGTKFNAETYQVRTKKILMISETIATSSSAVQAVVTNNPKNFDLGGAAVLLYRLFTDVRFTAKLKEDYLNDGLNEIYEERAKGILG